MPNYTQAQLKDMILQALPDNNQELISASDIRQVFSWLIDSIPFLSDVGGGTGGGGKFGPTAPNVNTPVGGIPMNYALANKEYGEVLQDMLVRFIEPTVSLSHAATAYERGTSLNTFAFSYSAAPGNDNLIGLALEWDGKIIYQVPNGPGGTPPLSGTINIDLRTLNVAGLTPDPARKINSLSGLGPRTFRLIGDYNDRGNKYSTLVFTFPAPFYFGNGNSASVFASLNKAALEADNSRSGLVFNNNNNKMILAFDATFPNLTVIRDAVSGYNIIGGFNAPVLLNHTFADGNTTQFKVYLYGATISPSTNTLSTS